MLRLPETKTTRTAAYAAEAAMVSWFEARVRRETTRENITMQTETVVKCASLLDCLDRTTNGTTRMGPAKRATRNRVRYSARSLVFW